MQDLIFGTLSTDELKLISHRAYHRGVQHDQRLNPLDPLPGEAVKISVLTGVAAQVDKVACYYTTDDSQPEGSRGIPENGRVILLEKAGIDWDTFNWGYLIRWEGTLPPQTEGTIVRYRIGTWSEGSQEIFANWPDVKATVENAARAYFHKEPFPSGFLGDPTTRSIFNYHVDTFQSPQWARESLIYHIFVDRFNPGNGKDWIQTSNLKDFIGGTIWGITEKLDYVQELGADTIWLS
ncbi:MAG: hypothetical protein IBX69_15730, partial [Anaerolineales bacterium]|nr:hypothetical protein [Anaerolineales bacterium]